MLASGLMLMAFLTLVCSLNFDKVTIGRREVKRLYDPSIPLFELPPLARIAAATKNGRRGSRLDFACRDRYQKH